MLLYYKLVYLKGQKPTADMNQDSDTIAQTDPQIKRYIGYFESRGLHPMGAPIWRTP
uniref:Uncharacterized protein n=1 Tax=Arundo donax TaxID=35708 RepID=A0A0A8YJX0_ARUDO